MRVLVDLFKICQAELPFHKREASQVTYIEKASQLLHWFYNAPQFVEWPLLTRLKRTGRATPARTREKPLPPHLGIEGLAYAT